MDITNSAGRNHTSLGTCLARPSPLLALALIVVVALILKVSLLVSESVAFTSDEAVIALMGKHITQGQIPIFYYGEAYVGSLDAILVAIAFTLIGQSVLAVRLVQVTLYIGTILATYLLTRRMYADESAARVAILMMAIPPVLLSLHTTAGLGSYGETLFIGTILLLIGHCLLTDKPESWLLWATLGLLSGLGFWTFGLILVYLLPIGLLMVPRLKRRSWGRYLLSGLCFLVGSAPWWWYNLNHDWKALRVLFVAEAGTAIAELPLWQRALGVLGLGLPALIGLRPSWSVEWISPLLSPLIVVFYLAVAISAVRHWPRERRIGQALLLLFVFGFLILLIGTRFGADATGRYMIPLYSAAFPLCGVWLDRAKKRHTLGAYLILAFVLCFNLLGNVKAMTDEKGLTTEFWSKVRFNRQSDEALIKFLLDQDLHYGYSNRHTHFRIDFLSDEQVLLLPRLSSRTGLCINLDGRGDRYSAYTEQVEGSPVLFYVTTEQPYLDELLRDRFADLEVTYKEKTIAPYRIFYDLSHPVRPQDMCGEEDGL